jgi:ferrous iron transport protein A
VKTPESTSNSSLPLAQLRKGESAIVSGLVEVAGLAGEDTGAVLLARLRDLGFTPGARCEVIARMWLGGDPLVVRIGGSTFALRRAEAAAVRVTPLASQSASRSSLATSAATA